MNTIKAIQKLTSYNPKEVFAEFRAKIHPYMTPEERTVLEAEYTQAMLKDRDKHFANQKRISKENTQFFLEDPVTAILQCYDGNYKTWTIGEELQFSGIGSVTMKRFGKVVLIGQGTIGEGTISNFHVTVTIGDQVMEQDVGCRNDRHSKEMEIASDLGLLGSRIINKYLEAHPERSAELDPISHRIYKR